MGLFDALMFRVGLDTSAVKTGMKEIEGAAKKTGQAAGSALKPIVGTADAQTKMNAATDAATKSTAKLGQGTQALAQQLPDVIAGFTGGQRAMTIFSQQGLQVAQQTGLVQKGLVALAGTSPVTAAALGALTTVVAAGALGWLAYTDAERDAAEANEIYAASIVGVAEAVEQNQQRLIALRLASGELTEQQAQLETTMRGAFVSSLGAMEESQAKLTEIRSAQEGLGTAVADFADRWAPAWAPLPAAIDLATTSSKEYEQQIQALRDAQNQHVKALKARRDLEEQLSILEASAPVNRVDNSVKVAAEKERAAQRARQAAAAAANEAERQAEAEARATEQLLAIAQRSYIARLDGEEQINAQYDAQLEKIEALAVASGDWQAAEAARIDTELERLKELGDFQVAEAKRVADAEAAEAKRVADEKKRQAQMEQDYRDQTRDRALSATTEIGQRLIEEGGKAALAGFAITKASALAQVGIDTAAAITKGIAIFGPPPSPAGIAAVASAGLIGATQATLIASQPPPSFHAGGVIASKSTDAVQINALPGESVLNRSATARLGRDGVDELNRGGGANNNASRVVVQNQYKHRVFDAFIGDNVARSSSPLRKAIKGSSRVGHRKRT